MKQAARRKVVHRKHPPHKHQPTGRKMPQAIMRIPAPIAQPWKLNDEEIGLVKSHIAPGATDAELKFCLAVARRHRLDPFRGQIWFVPRNIEQGDQKVRKWIPIVGIGGLLHIAARDHKDFGIIGEPEFGPPIKVTYQVNGYGKVLELTVPEWARIKGWKKGFPVPSVARVKFKEIYKTIDYSPMVRQMPEHLLGKCAMAHLIRKCWPATDGLYIAAEMQPQGPPEFTSGGRRIVYPEVQEHRTLDLPPADEDQHVKDYLARLTPAERAAEEAAMARQKQDPKRQTDASVIQEPPVAGSGNGGRTDDAAAPARPRQTVNYVWSKETQSARIVQPPKGVIDQSLKALLRKFVKGDHVELNGEELEAMKYEFDRRGLDLEPLRREPGE
jgi:hypothetical protein